ncbi:hypothetical protein [Accumulibacter sp.]|uniref:PP2C family protein-serine/threonine phosphatase n=1 Tax=Accumulibacter sp. TaxID=2053492 RepID=UPI00339011FA
MVQGRITPEQALVHPNRNILLTSLGGGDAPKIAFGEAEGLQAGDTFLLCSDGLWGYFTDQELAWVISGSSSAREATELLIGRARSDGPWRRRQHLGGHSEAGQCAPAGAGSHARRKDDATCARSPPSSAATRRRGLCGCSLRADTLRPRCRLLPPRDAVPGFRKAC